MTNTSPPHDGWKNKRVLITGSTAGIGLDLARRATRRGATVIVHGRDRAKLEAVAKELGAPSFGADLSDLEQCTGLAKDALEATDGEIDILVNNAAWGSRMMIEDFDEERFEAMWKSNVVAPAILARELIPSLERNRGAIVNIASTAAIRGYPGGSAYSSTKFALRSMSQCWAAELRPRNIRVLNICPSEVQTGFGGADPDREMNPNKLIGDDIAAAIESALDLPDRGYIPELTVFATNPWAAE